jgi:RNA polymerase sigma factor (sigma-70 family)
MTEKEKALLAGCVHGDKAAWDGFVRQYSALVYHTINKTLALHHRESRDETVEDLYQEFFIAILQNNCRKLSQFRGDGGCTLASFLRVVASRLTIDHLRQQPRPTVDVPDTLSSDEPTAADRLIARETEEALAAVLATLSGRERLLIKLHYQRGLPAEKVALLLKTSPGALYTQKSRLLDKLREILTKTPGL